MNYKIFNKKRVLITGASGGVGAALALKFAEQGCHLFLTGRKGPAIKSLIRKIRRAGGPNVDIFYALADLRNPKDLKKVVLSARKKIGEIDILINCAGAFYQKTLLRSRLKDFDDCFDLNVRAMFFLIRGFAKDMIKNKWGRIINVGSSSSYAGYKGTSVYCASKHAVLGLSRSLHDELKEHNVRVICVSPSSMKTRMGKATKNQKFDTFIDPEEFAEYVLFSCGLDGMMVSKEIRLERMYVQ